MPEKKKLRPVLKESLHPRNRHRGRYDLDRLSELCPDLKPFIYLNDYGDQSVDFFEPAAVLALNKALLLAHYDIAHWQIPAGYLCPPIPGRADYVHYMADLLAEENDGLVPRGGKVRCLDIGIGSSCIYPIIGRKEYDWTFIGTDIDTVALDSARRIVEENPLLTDRVHCRLQTRPADVFHGVLEKGERLELMFCNPPFHSSEADARAASARKLSNLKGKKTTEPVLNFGGKSNELWALGGEKRFIRNLVKESKTFSHSCYYFSTLVSKESNLKPIMKSLNKAQVNHFKVIEMGQGNKVSRIVAWTFLTKEERAEWRKLQGFEVED